MTFSCPPHIIRAYKCGDFTDLVISCGSSTFDVHSVVVCSACVFFAQSLKFGGKEAEKRRIDLPDDDPEMIRRLMSYLYLGDYDPTDDFGITALEQLKQHESNTAAATAHHRRKGVFGSSQPYDRCACLALNTKKIEQPVSDKITPHHIMTRTPDNSIEIANPLTIHATMYALADKYQVDGLGQVAKAKFKESLDCHVDSEDFIAAVQLTYSNTPESNRGLRDVIVQAFKSYFQVNIAELPGLESKLDTIDELSFLLLKSWPRKIESPSPQKHVLAGSVAHTGPNTGTSTAPSNSGALAPTSYPWHMQTASTTSSRASPPTSIPATGSLFGSLPPRTSNGFGSFQSATSNTGNTQTSRPSPFGMS